MARREREGRGEREKKSGGILGETRGSKGRRECQAASEEAALCRALGHGDNGLCSHATTSHCPAQLSRDPALVKT